MLQVRMTEKKGSTILASHEMFSPYLTMHFNPTILRLKVNWLSELVHQMIFGLVG